MRLARRCAVGAGVVAAACSTPKAPLAEPQAPRPFASVVIECPPTLDEKDAAEGGVHTTEAELSLALVRDDGESFHIESACTRSSKRPVHVAPGTSRLTASYEERVKKQSSVLEARVNCELPLVTQDWLAGKTYVYRVTVGQRDPQGRFGACNVTLGEATAPSSSASATAHAPPAPQ